MSVADVVFLLYILVYVYNMFYYYRSARRSWEKFDVVHTAPVTRISLGIESHGAFAIGDLNVVNFHLHPRCANWNVHAHFRSAEIRGQDLILGLSASGLHHCAQGVGAVGQIVDRLPRIGIMGLWRIVHNMKSPRSRVAVFFKVGRLGICSFEMPSLGLCHSASVVFKAGV